MDPDEEKKKTQVIEEELADGNKSAGKGQTTRNNNSNPSMGGEKQGSGEAKRPKDQAKQGINRKTWKKRATRTYKPQTKRKPGIYTSAPDPLSQKHSMEEKSQAQETQYQKEGRGDENMEETEAGESKTMETQETPDMSQPTKQKLITEYFHSQETQSEQASEIPPQQSKDPTKDRTETEGEDGKDKRPTYLKIAQIALGKSSEPKKQTIQ